MNNKKTFIALGIFFGIFIVLTVIFTLWSDAQFRVVSASPSDKLATSSSLISINFNRELASADDQPDNYIQVFPQNIDIVVSAENKNVSVVLKNQLQKDTVITIVLQDIASADGQTLSYKLELPVEYVEFKDLDKQEQTAQILESTVTGDDHPLLSILPFDNLLFHIDSIIDEVEYGKATDWKSEKDNFIVLIDVFALRGSLTDEQYKLKVLELRGLAEKWILEETGVNPKTDINILFSPSDGDIGIGGPEVFGD